MEWSLAEEPTLHLPEFNCHVRDVVDALRVLDRFDLHSEDPASVKKWEELNQLYATAVLALLVCVQEAGPCVAFELGTLVGQAHRRD